MKEIRVLPIEDIEWRESGSGQGQMTVRGHAAVFNRLSHDLGGFQERIAPGAFSEVLDKTPDVHLLWDHDTARTLARTRNKTLELREDPAGLHFWARVAPTSYADDLRILMERGDVDQASFAFTVGDETWDVDEDDEPVRTIRRVNELFDVTITAQGAFPQTDASLAISRSIAKAIKSGDVRPEEWRQVIVTPDTDHKIEIPAAHEDEGPEAEESPPQPEERQVDEDERAVAQELADRDAHLEALRELKAHTRDETVAAKTYQLKAQRKVH